MKNIIFAITFLLLLSSCGPKPGSTFWYKLSEPQERVAYYKNICLSYGYSDGTSNMADCIATEMRKGSEKASAGMQSIKDTLDEASSSGRRVTCQTYGTITNCREY
jgi:hypothetical protein